MTRVIGNFFGMLSGVIVGMLLFPASGAFAYEQTSVTEGQLGSYRLKLPSFPHEARRHSSGYSAVRYSICTSDGTAKGGGYQRHFSAAITQKERTIPPSVRLGGRLHSPAPITTVNIWT